MADTFKGEVKLSIGWKWTTDGGVIDDDKVSYWKKWADGYADNQAEAAWIVESGTLLEDGSVTYDLTALTRTLFGDTTTITLTRIKGLIIVNKNTTAIGKLVVGNAAANAWSAPWRCDGTDTTITTDVLPDSPLVLANRQDGWDVSATQKNILLTARNGAVTYDIAVVGTVSSTGIGSSS